ncbi:hypothetical protein CSOJ01_05805 [Colletotrichum sojae]|uniref:Uncharacterized protein n=1 Tax=Colletotrichum sojae TaxID=2175907 RepID=A0A8H6MW69_9PEZI|nr:hypothetical protein CSOJ01_05805 [Colletotrichum sojae]
MYVWRIISFQAGAAAAAIAGLDYFRVLVTSILASRNERRSLQRRSTARTLGGITAFTADQLVIGGQIYSYPARPAQLANRPEAVAADPYSEAARWVALETGAHEARNGQYNTASSAWKE